MLLVLLKVGGGSLSLCLSLAAAAPSGGGTEQRGGPGGEGAPRPPPAASAESVAPDGAGRDITMPEDDITSAGEKRAPVGEPGGSR